MYEVVVVVEEESSPGMTLSRSRSRPHKQPGIREASSSVKRMSHREYAWCGMAKSEHAHLTGRQRL